MILLYEVCIPIKTIFNLHSNHLVYRSKPETLAGIRSKTNFLSSLGFYENQASELLRKKTLIIGLTEEKIKRKVDVLVKIAGLLLIDLIRYP